MIVDAHVHVWVQNPAQYPWQPIGGYIPESEAPVEKLLSIMDANGVDGAVLVQPTPYGWDNRYLLDCARNYPDRFRSVCLVDPYSEMGSRSLQALVENHQAQGIRINWNLKPAAEWQNNTHHAVLWETASKLNIPICLQMTSEMTDLLRDFAGRFSKVNIVIDHLGRPKQAVRPTDPDFVDFLNLSQFPNLYVKLSGLYYYSSQSAAPYQDVLPLVQAVFRQYGAQRCLWGSDFPFIEERWSYAAMLEAVKNDWSMTAAELNWVLGGTAYSLWWS